MNDYHAAEDITQETIRKMIEYPCKIKELEGNQLRNYIARSAENTGRDYLKKMNKNNSAVIYTEDLPERERELSGIFDTYEYVITKLTVEDIKTALRNMKPEYRDPIVLHKLNKYTIPEVSKLLDVPERTVKYRIHKGIQILREVLKKGDVINEQ